MKGKDFSILCGLLYFSGKPEKQDSRARTFSVQACFRDSLGPLELEGACLPFYHLFNQLKVHAQQEGSTKQVGA